MRVAANQRHVICKRNHWKNPEDIVTDVYIFMLHKDIAAEKQSDILIQMALKHVLVWRFRKKEIDE